MTPSFEKIKSELLEEDEVFIVEETGARFTMRDSK